MDFQLLSDAFKQGEKLPSLYTCEGENISPPLSWKNFPKETKSFVLICDDPDAKTLWTHWIFYNIPPTVTNLSKNIPNDEKFSNGSQQGLNSSNEVGYEGPCPPRGVHRYFFKIYALDCLLSLQSKASRKELDNAIKNHILAEASLLGTYQRAP